MGIIYCNLNANDCACISVRVNLHSVTDDSALIINWFLFTFYSYLPDSPRWMLRMGRVKEAKKILEEGGTKNKRPIPVNLENLLQQEIDSG